MLMPFSLMPIFFFIFISSFSSSLSIFFHFRRFSSFLFAIFASFAPLFSLIFLRLISFAFIFDFLAFFASLFMIFSLRFDALRLSMMLARFLRFLRDAIFDIFDGVRHFFIFEFLRAAPFSLMSCFAACFAISFRGYDDAFDISLFQMMPLFHFLSDYFRFDIFFLSL